MFVTALLTLLLDSRLAEEKDLAPLMLFIPVFILVFIPPFILVFKLFSPLFILFIPLFILFIPLFILLFTPLFILVFMLFDNNPLPWFVNDDATLISENCFMTLLDIGPPPILPPPPYDPLDTIIPLDTLVSGLGTLTASLFPSGINWGERLVDVAMTLSGLGVPSISSLLTLDSGLASKSGKLDDVSSLMTSGPTS